jgi:hypothetical protein
MTRRIIERELDQIREHLPRRWWTPYAIFAGAVVVGVVLSRIPLLKLVETGARTVRTGAIVASAVAAVDRLAAQRRIAA